MMEDDRCMVIKLGNLTEDEEEELNDLLYEFAKRRVDNEEDIFESDLDLAFNNHLTGLKDNNTVEWMVDVWNKVVPIGTPVLLTNDHGKVEETKTRSKAWIIPHKIVGTPLVMVEEISGGYLLDRIVPKGD